MKTINEAMNEFKTNEAKTSDDGTLFVNKLEKVSGKWFAPSDELHTNDGWKAIELPSKLIGQFSTRITNIKNVIDVRHSGGAGSKGSFTFTVKPKDFDLASGDLSQLQDYFNIVRIWSSDGKNICISLMEK